MKSLWILLRLGLVGAFLTGWPGAEWTGMKVLAVCWFAPDFLAAESSTDARPAGMQSVIGVVQ
jgi:hypothetical protein